jgi:hypothetical protein
LLFGCEVGFYGVMLNCVFEWVWVFGQVSEFVARVEVISDINLVLLIMCSVLG